VWLQPALSTEAQESGILQSPSRAEPRQPQPPQGLNAHRLSHIPGGRRQLPRKPSRNRWAIFPAPRQVAFKNSPRRAAGLGGILAAPAASHEIARELLTPPEMAMPPGKGLVDRRSNTHNARRSRAVEACTVGNGASQKWAIAYRYIRRERPPRLSSGIPSPFLEILDPNERSTSASRPLWRGSTPHILHKRRGGTENAHATHRVSQVGCHVSRT
jgi:hypothetical protein